MVTRAALQLAVDRFCAEVWTFVSAIRIDGLECPSYMENINTS